jgi:SPP1 family predicted phage head-tail adaptor
MVLREKIKFQRGTTASDGAGGKKLSGWEDLHTCYADVRPLSGVRALEYTQVTGKIGYEVTMRSQQETFTPGKDMSVLWRGIRLTIQGAIDTRNYRHIKFTAYGR